MGDWDVVELGVNRKKAEDVCPACGGDIFIYKTIHKQLLMDLYSVRCPACDLRGICFSTESEAVDMFKEGVRERISG